MFLARKFADTTLLSASRAIKPNQIRINESIRCFKRNVPRVIEVNNVEAPVGVLWKPLAFTVVITGGSLATAAIVQYENLRAHSQRMFKQHMDRFWSKRGSYRNEINTRWNSLTDAQKLFVPICALNVLVFAMWRIPRFQPTMLAYFCSNPASKAVCWPMLLSAFSHYSLFHLAANMYVLHSFSNGAVASLGKEQYAGVYISAAVISSLTSYLYKTTTRQVGMSLGASGAIMAILGYVCTQFPDTRLAIIFVPNFTFSAADAIKVIVAIDSIGMLLRWKFFDHAAHLGGALFGIFYAKYGDELIWQNRGTLLEYWHAFRGPIRKD